LSTEISCLPLCRGYYVCDVCVLLQGENVVKEVFPKKVAELNALLEVLVPFVYKVVCLLYCNISFVQGS